MANDAATWRAWAENASPALLEAFNGRALGCLTEVRKQYPAEIRPDEATYKEMKAACSAALLGLAHDVDPESEDWNDAVD